MTWLRRGGGFFTAIRAWLPLFLEIAVTLASARLTALLFRDQGYFEKYHTFYAWLLAYLPAEEWKWGLLAGTACGLKAIGLACMFFQRSERIIEIAFLLRSAGWCLSVILWGTFGLSIQFGDPWSLGAICCAAMAQLSIAALLMGPAMPEARHAAYEG